MGDLEYSNILLFSGGIDSTALAYSMRPDLALTVDYGQVCADAEILASEQICSTLGVEHEAVEVDCSDFGTGSLSPNEQVEEGPTPEWWPFRNQFLITVAGMKGVQIGADNIVVGTVEGDSDHADGQAGFFRSMDEVVYGQEGSLHVRVPAISSTSVELVEQSGVPERILLWSHSCHISNHPCGECRGCQKHYEVIEQSF